MNTERAFPYAAAMGSWGLDPEDRGGRFEQFLEFAPDAIVGIGADGTIVVVNAQTEALFGYTRAELLELKVEALVPERFRAVHPGHRAGYFADPRTRPMGAELELFGVRSDGTEFPAEISLSSIETEDGLLAIAAIRDITRRVQAEQKFEQFLEFAPDAIVGVGADGRDHARQRADRRRCSATRVTELLGEPVEPLVPERFHAVASAASRRVLRRSAARGRWARGSSSSGVRKDGSEFPAEISLSSIETEDGAARHRGDPRHHRSRRSGARRRRSRRVAGARHVEAAHEKQGLEASSTSCAGSRASASSPAASRTTSTTCSA